MQKEAHNVHLFHYDKQKQFGVSLVSAYVVTISNYGLLLQSSVL